MRPGILDLYCGAGGCSVGYHRAGFDPVGIDIHPQPNYPFPFIQANALELQPEHLHGFAAIHASPPCQGYTTMNQRWNSKKPRTMLIHATRRMLKATRLPYVIENVPGARAHLLPAHRLTGEMFDLGVHRPRLFETNWSTLQPYPPVRQKDAAAVYGKLDGRRLWTRTDGTELRASTSLEEASAAMGIDWMTWDELREAIPPAYTHWVGTQLLDIVTR